MAPAVTLLSLQAVYMVLSGCTQHTSSWQRLLQSAGVDRSNPSFAAMTMLCLQAIENLLLSGHRQRSRAAVHHLSKGCCRCRAKPYLRQVHAVSAGNIAGCAKLQG